MPEYKYSIKTDCIFRDADAAYKNLTTSAYSTLRNTKGIKCAIEDKEKKGKYTICRIRTEKELITFNGLGATIGYIRKGNLKLLDAYNFSDPYKTRSACTLYKLMTSKDELVKLKANTKVLALHGTEIKNSTTRYYVKVCLSGKTYKGWIEGSKLHKSSSPASVEEEKKEAKKAKNTTKTVKEKEAKQKKADIKKETKYLKSTINSLYAVPNTTASDK